MMIIQACIWETKKQVTGLTKKKIGLIALGCAVVIIIGAAVWIGNRSLNRNPKTEVLHALAQTYGEIKQSDQTLSTLCNEIFSGVWQQDITLGIDKLDTDLVALDPRILSAAGIVTLKNTTRRDTAANKLTDTLSVQFAVTPLAELTVYADPDLLAFTVPKIFDYYVTADPRRIADEWDASLLGTYLTTIGGTILQDEFYAYYTRLLFSAPKTPAAQPDWLRHIGILDEKAEYVYMDRSAIQTENEPDMEADAYEIRIPAESLNAFWAAANPAGAIERLPGDLIGESLNALLDGVSEVRFRDIDTNPFARLYVRDGKVVLAELHFCVIVNGAAWFCDWSFKFSGETANLDDVRLSLLLMDETGRMYEVTGHHEARVGNPDLTYSVGELSVRNNRDALPLSVSWNLSWDRTVKTGDNLTLNATAKIGNVTDLSMDARGQLAVDYAARRVDLNMKNLALAMYLPQGNLNMSFNAQYWLRTDDEPVTYNEDGCVPLTTVNEMDLLAMYTRLSADPQLGTLLDLLQ